MEQIGNSNTLEKNTGFIVGQVLPEETTEEYLSRVRYDFFKYYVTNNASYKNQDSGELQKYRHNIIRKADRELSKNDRLLKVIFENLEYIGSLKNIPPSKSKKALTFQKLKEATTETIVDPVKNANDFENKIEFFESTHQERDFFSKGKRYDSQSHDLALFGIPRVFLDSVEGKKYLHNLLDSKNIYLFGGGNSVNDLMANEEYKPGKIINIDPYLKSEDILKNKNNMYESIPISAADKNLQVEIDSKNLPKADEIWANYSVPFYLHSGDEIKNLVRNIDYILSVNGTARIHPISLKDTEDNQGDFTQKREAFIGSIRELMEKGNFNISIFENTLIIRKLREEIVEKENDIKEEMFRKSYPEILVRKKLRKLRRRLHNNVELPEEKIFKYLELAKDLCDIEPNGFQETARFNLTGFAKIFSENYEHGTPIQCFSVASNALTENSELKQKDQYLKFNKIAEKLNDIFSRSMIQFTYQVILADIDQRYNLEKFAKQWELNVVNLQEKTSAPVLRLSELFPEYQESMNEISQEKDSYFDSQITRIEKALPQFHTTPEKARFQMTLYSAIGKIMQKKFITGILFDVQKKIYPYEQPFYNKARLENPIPIIRVNNI